MKFMKKTELYAAARSAENGLNPVRNKGFTLAEVLITLVIIGIIGALTVPSLIQNTQKQEYVSALKKTYSTLSQAAQLIISEEGSPKYTEGGWAKDNDTVYEMFKKYLNSAKDCGKEAGCSYKTYYHLNETSPSGMNLDDYTSSGKLILADGTLLLFGWTSQNCTMNYTGSSNTCVTVIADINGMKGPNRVGRDIYQFVLENNGLYPRGCADAAHTDCNKGSGLGWSCACRVIQENAMNY